MVLEGKVGSGIRKQFEGKGASLGVSSLRFSYRYELELENFKLSSSVIRYGSN